MKKIFIFLPLLFSFAFPAKAANDNTNGQKQQVQQQLKLSLSPTNSQNQNQNQLQTQNQGENQQVQVRNQEQENSGTGEGLQNRSQNALEHMSNVAKQVQLLLQARTAGGIGEQVREIARQQNQAQEQIQEQLNKLESKSQLAKLLTGTDYGAVKNLKAQLVQNQNRIKQLEQLQNQLTNQGDIILVQETIQALIQENTSLQERITAEEQTKSLLGWLFKFFLR